MPNPRSADKKSERLRYAYRVLGWRARSTWSHFVRRFNRLELSENAILFGFAVAIGAATALGVVGFYRLIDLAYLAFYNWPANYFPHPVFLAYRPLVTGAGLAVASLIMARMGRGGRRGGGGGWGGWRGRGGGGGRGPGLPGLPAAGHGRGPRRGVPDHGPHRARTRRPERAGCAARGGARGWTAPAATGAGAHG